MVRPLLQYSTTRAQYEYEVMRPRLEISQKLPKVERTVKRATLNMQRQAGRFDMNSVRRRSDMGMKGVVERANYEADLGKQTASETTANYVDFGNAVAMQHKGGNIPDSMWSRTMQHSQGDLVLVPVSAVDIHYIPANLAVDFVPGEMTANWDVGRAKLDFVPGSFSINFTQYASLNIEFVGGFIYVPPSADPSFEAEA